MTQIKPDERLDLVGVTCPQNAARILLKIEGMEPGAILEVIIDDGEPIKNVPRAIKEERHKIINATRVNNDKWRLLIRRV